MSPSIDTTQFSTSLPHGGDRASAEATFGAPAKGWLDLSTGIAPWAYPALALAPEFWSRLPDANDSSALCAAAAKYFDFSDPTLIVPAPGTQAAIQWLPRLRARSTVAIVGPTYGEHAQCWRAAGHIVADIQTLPPAEAYDVVVLTNPNNPDGMRTPPEAIVRLAERRSGSGGWLIVDEAFADVAPELSVAASAGLPGLIVLRSFGKFFGLAGLRLGFVLSERSIARALGAALGPWAVSGPALAIGKAALADEGWIEAQRTRAKETALKLDSLLRGKGFAPQGGTDLFRLFAHADAQAVHARLGSAGIMVRRFPERTTWLRFGLPGSEADWARLETALGA